MAIQLTLLQFTGNESIRVLNAGAVYTPLVALMLPAQELE